MRRGKCVSQRWPYGNYFKLLVDWDGRERHGTRDSGADSLSSDV